jgi:hypothetical protein
MYPSFPDFFQSLMSRVVCYFNKVQAKGMGFDLKFASNKEDFAKKVVPLLSAQHFEVFRPMFEFIKQKCLEDLPERQHVDEKLAESV